MLGDTPSEAAPLNGEPAGSLSGVLVTPGSPTEAEQLYAQAEAKRSSPQAAAEREASRTEFEGLDGEQAGHVDGEAFPGVVDEPAGGPPKLSAGESIKSYLSDDAAQVELPENKHGVIESTAPMAIESSPGQRTPVDLSLSEAGAAFAPKTPVVPVRIPKRLGGGVSLGSTGVSVTPVDAQGNALDGSEGALVGASVLYANTQTDTDTLVRPTTFGFEANTMLRSVESPSQLYFRVGLPEGASLVSAKGGSGAVEVVDEGATIAMVLPPSARDADGTVVPVSMSLSGDVVTLTVDQGAGEYRYPLEVDPTVVAEANGEYDDLYRHSWPYSWWKFYTPYPESFSGGCPQFSCKDSSKNHSAGQWAEFYYETQGASRIYAVTTKTVTYQSYKKLNEEPSSASSLRIQSEAGVEKGPVTLPSGGAAETTLCVREGCGAEKVESKHQANGVYYEQEALVTETEKLSFEDELTKASVSIEQEAGPSAKFATSLEAYNGMQNPLYGNRWANSVEPYKWVLPAEASDPGIGVYKEIWSSPNAPNWGTTFSSSETEYPIGHYEDFANCQGVQCEGAAGKTLLWGYELDSKRLAEPQHLPDGEDTVELKAEDAVGLSATATTKVKIDSTPPYNLTLSGLPSNHEISDEQHFLLKASATDGTKPTVSSGIASIALTMDGQVVGSPSKGCSPGECTVTGEWTLNGEAYAAGTYTLAVVATDNAGNVATEDYTVTIQHAGDIAVGPGSVSPTTGELALSATDVSVSAPDGGLTVGRSYRSRHLAVEAESPLGPQWGLSLGASESLYRTPSGGMVLTGTSGGQSVFASNGKGGYTSPPGDAGLTLTAQGSKFLLSENGAVTTFAVPSGGSGGVWEPSVSEGAGGTNATTFAYKTEGGITEPTEELAPVPSGVSCSPTLNNGCRALSFVYATKTKESIGEGPSEWGEYKGRLQEVTFTAYEPSSKEMKTKAVAQYVYDKQGRLRA
ncbi:MAG TPA: Ig-like domain-containing protein, partial [Solirubrobacteraceae bacterium]|nr:Ig-like domain-containing protein [Solirubrobacteraceae bacterium]